MRALTIKQPWADAIVHGEKRVENRTWTRSYRGPILIHAGAGYDLMGRFLITDRAALNSWPNTPSAILAVADITDIHQATGTCCEPWGEPHDHVYHWTLANIRPLPTPVPAKGRQGLWTPNPELLAAVEQQLQAVTR